MSIIELRAKRNKAWEAAKAFAETHQTDKGTLSAEDNATYTGLPRSPDPGGRSFPGSCRRTRSSRQR